MHEALYESGTYYVDEEKGCWSVEMDKDASLKKAEGLGIVGE